MIYKIETRCTYFVEAEGPDEALEQAQLDAYEFRDEAWGDPVESCEEEQLDAMFGR